MVWTRGANTQESISHRAALSSCTAAAWLSVHSVHKLAWISAGLVSEGSASPPNRCVPHKHVGYCLVACYTCMLPFC